MSRRPRANRNSHAAPSGQGAVMSRATPGNLTRMAESRSKELTPRPECYTSGEASGRPHQPRLILKLLPIPLQTGHDADGGPGRVGVSDGARPRVNQTVILPTRRDGMPYGDLVSGQLCELSIIS